MIWRVVVVVLCIIIITSAVWAASNSFAVSVEGPNTFGTAVTIATPTPAAVDVNHRFTMSEYDGNSTDPLHFDASIPSTHVVLMTGRQDESLGVFHLCMGDFVGCSGGILSLDAQFLDRDGDKLADKLRVYFDKSDFEALLSSVSDAPVAEAVQSADTRVSAVMDGTNDETGSSSSDDFDPKSTLGAVVFQVGEYRDIRLTISGKIDAWRIATP